MNTLIVLVVLHSFLLPASVQSAPTTTSPQAFREAVEQATGMVNKILDKIPTVYAATVTIPGLTLNPPSQSAELEMMRVKLDIPNAPVIKPLSERFTLDMCVSRMLAGVQLHQTLVEVLSDKLSGLNDLKAELKDLGLRINKMKEVGQLSSDDGSDQNSGSDLANHLPGNYEVQVAVHLTLTQLQSFCHDMIRSLRSFNN